jgi:ATP-dependent helicase HrpA
VVRQLSGLIGPQFVRQTPYEYLIHLPRYFKAITLRIDKLRANPPRDAQCLADWNSVYQPWQKLLAAQKSYNAAVDGRLEDFKWQLAAGCVVCSRTKNTNADVCEAFAKSPR